MYPRQVLADGRNVASPAIYAMPPAKYHRASIKARARQNDHAHALSKAVGSFFYTSKTTKSLRQYIYIYIYWTNH